MTRTPELRAETPPRAAAAGLDPPEDQLSDLLATVHLSGTVLFRAELGEPWAVAVPEARDLASLLPFPTEHVVPFHLVDEGRCWIELDQGQRVSLGPGEAVLLPHGAAHLLGAGGAARVAPVGTLLPRPPWPDTPRLRHGGQGAPTRIVCGFVHCEELLFNPFLGGLPALLHARPGADPAARWLETTLRYTAHEAARADPGARSTLPRLTELMFVEVLRHHMRTLRGGEVGWLAAATDPILGQALGRLHQAPAAPWTVDALARQVGVSRTVLAERFAARLGQPPMRYLARWRLQIGARLLETTVAPLKVVAAQAGYDSEAAFGRAFKRLFGVPPADWRRRQRHGAPLAARGRPGDAPAAAALPRRARR